MANLSAKAIRVTRKKHKVLNKLLHPPGGLKAYILKRDGREKSFTILAIFDNFGTEFDRFRHSEYFEFAVQPGETFTTGDTTRSMRQVAEIATHVATVENLNGESVVYAIRTGDEYKPYYMDFTYRYFTKQISDRFDPADNQET